MSKIDVYNLLCQHGLAYSTKAMVCLGIIPYDQIHVIHGSHEVSHLNQYQLPLHEIIITYTALHIQDTHQQQ